MVSTLKGTVQRYYPLRASHAPSRETVVLIVAVRTRVDIRAIEIQVVDARRSVGSR